MAMDGENGFWVRSVGRCSIDWNSWGIQGILLQVSCETLYKPHSLLSSMWCKYSTNLPTWAPQQADWAHSHAGVAG